MCGCHTRTVFPGNFNRTTMFLETRAGVAEASKFADHDGGTSRRFIVHAEPVLVPGKYRLSGSASPAIPQSRTSQWMSFKFTKNLRSHPLNLFARGHQAWKRNPFAESDAECQTSSISEPASSASNRVVRRRHRLRR